MTLVCLLINVKRGPELAKTNRILAKREYPQQTNFEKKFKS